VVVTASVAMFGVARPASAQIKKSQHGTVSQTIAATAVTITYNRPTARGRALFGALVPYGKEWHPGADEATTITVSKDILVAGKRLPAGKYSILGDSGPERVDPDLQQGRERLAHPLPRWPGPAARQGEGRWWTRTARRSRCTGGTRSCGCR